MESIIKKDIEEILQKIVSMLKYKGKINIAEMKELSNHTIHNASIFQDEDSLSIAILIYSFSKIINRKKGKINVDLFLELFTKAISGLENDDPDAYRKTIKKIFRRIAELDSKLRFYIEEVFNQAQINKGTKLYEHGISMARAAEVLGISQWELMDYIGKTSISDAFEKEVINVRDRIRYVRSLFP